MYYEFVLSLWNFTKKNRNALSEIVTHEYSLMRCIHWAVCFSLTGGRPYKTNYIFLILFFLSKFGISRLLTEFSWQNNVWKHFIRNSYFRIHSYGMYSLGRLLLIDRWTRPYKTKYLFLIVNFFIFGICRLIMEISWKIKIRKRLSEIVSLWIHSYEMYSLGRLLLLDRWASLQNQLSISDF